jgi:hypothetical protein
MRRTGTSATGFTPTLLLNATPRFWYSEPVNGTFSASSATFTLWTNSPGASSVVAVALERTDLAGANAVTLAQASADVNASGTGNHTTRVSLALPAFSLSSQRLRVRLTRASGADPVVVFNGGTDFDTRLEIAAPVTPFNPCPPQGTPCAIMPLGDDMTVGTPDPAAGGYRARLFHDALAKHQSIVFVGGASDGPATVDGVAFPRAHEGHEGFTIDDSQFRMGISPLVPNAIATRKPNIVLLMIGTNDVDTGVTAIPDRLGALMDTILNADPKLLLVVAEVIPQQRATPLDQQVQAYDDAIPALVKSRADLGKHVMLVDMSTPFRSTPDYGTVLFADRLHPSPAGYALIGDTWYSAIGPLLR